MKLSMSVAALLVATTRTFRTATSFSPAATQSISRRSFGSTISLASAPPKDATPVTTSSSALSDQDAEAVGTLKSPFLQVMRDRGFLSVVPTDS